MVLALLVIIAGLLGGIVLLGTRVDARLQAILAATDRHHATTATLVDQRDLTKGLLKTGEGLTLLRERLASRVAEMQGP